MQIKINRFHEFMQYTHAFCKIIIFTKAMIDTVKQFKKKVMVSLICIIQFHKSRE